jgi:hypothetical protein
MNATLDRFLAASFYLLSLYSATLSRSRRNFAIRHSGSSLPRSRRFVANLAALLVFPASI